MIFLMEDYHNLSRNVYFGKMGATIDLSEIGGNNYETFFSEAQSGIVITTSHSNLDQVLTHFQNDEVPAYIIGEAGAT